MVVESPKRWAAARCAGLARRKPARASSLAEPSVKARITLALR
jgi:hypothetical protein